MLCDVLVGWGRAGGREVQEGGDTCIHIAQQTPTQHYKELYYNLKNF